MLDLLVRWTDRGWRAEMFVLQATNSGERLAPLPPHIRTRWGTQRHGRFRYLWPLALAKLVAASRRHDVVVSGSEIGYGVLLGHLAARLARRPFVVVVHADAAEAIQTWVPKPLRRLNERALRKADLLVCVSRGIARGLTRDLSIPEKRLAVVANSVDVARVRRLAGEAPLQERSGRTVPAVVSVGRLAAEKGHDVLVRASSELVRRGVPHRIVVLGEGEERARLEELIAELGATVELRGHEANPFPWMASADLVCLPSRREGMPLVLLEALALGVPVLATECGDGCLELLAHGKFGGLVPVDEPTALADAIERHVADPRDLTDRAAAAAAALEAQKVGAMAVSYERLLAELISGQRELSSRA